MQHSPLIAWAEFTCEREEGKATLSFSSWGSARLRDGFSLSHRHLFCLSLSSQPKNEMPPNYIEKHSNVFIHSLNKLTDQVTAMKNKQMIAKLGKFQAEKPLTMNKTLNDENILRHLLYMPKPRLKKSIHQEVCQLLLPAKQRITQTISIQRSKPPSAFKSSFVLTPSACFFPLLCFNAFGFCFVWFFKQISFGLTPKQKSKEFRVKYQGSSSQIAILKAKKLYTTLLCLLIPKSPISVCLVVCEEQRSR